VSTYNFTNPSLLIDNRVNIRMSAVKSSTDRKRLKIDIQFDMDGSCSTPDFTTLELLRRCFDDDDQQAWCELWLLFFEVAGNPVQRLLKNRGFNAADAEDVVMDVWLDLFRRDQRKFRTFQGHSRAQLCRWFVRVATNAARNWIEKHHRRLREQPLDSAARCVLHDHAGPTELEVGSLLSDLESITNFGDTERLRVLAGLKSGAARTERTHQRWKETLGRKYGPRLKQMRR
jgi:DNA-directed RNA polymerase specialized sigma24 family protein